jgi:hypothetical protein
LHFVDQQWRRAAHWSEVSSPRLLLVIGFVVCTGVAACGGSKATMSSLSCGSVASAEALCDRQGCDPTWSAVETNHAYCDQSVVEHGAANCGDYHVLTSLGLDYGSTYYYRRDTGALVAVQSWGAPSPTGTCTVVAAQTFSPPGTCERAALSELPGWCAGDAGALD